MKVLKYGELIFFSLLFLCSVYWLWALHAIKLPEQDAVRLISHFYEHHNKWQS